MIFEKLDLNLLRLFEAVMQTGNVTRAALRLGLTQSAASNGLARLREGLGDPLFIRRPGGVEATARARDLAGPVAEALSHLRQALDGQRLFDPAHVETEVVIGTSDHAELVLGPRLATHLAAAAPGIALTFRHCDRSDALALIDEGAVQLALGPLPEPPSRMTRQFLTREGFAVLLRPGHPAADALDLDAYIAGRHMLVSAIASRDGLVDRLLAERGLGRRLGPVASHYLAAGAMLAGTDDLLTLPASVAAVLAAAFGLVSRPVPLDMPAMRLSMIWHRRNAEAPLHRWLRRSVALLAKAGPRG
ncbi:LysR family transcriptional regulator [Zavarzinia compransoris]|uniref:LysR family transcriptional regulator n=1 Tax=Zavarzinia compransoris TaxID=1264899 RepID=A0A317E399_9PROT|nr:LysR family transcriptional regulator [Zavarzinia compransoris]PWR20616.1 LysR family transcriptional regulator [Zavarzinia compransoris]TDP44569.1 LysR family transcriptional regulator [Zavarzinia compransoris]